MGKARTKVYIYTRVSTAMQIDGYSLDSQKARMKDLENTKTQASPASPLRADLSLTV